MVSDDPQAAADLVARGADVVLVVADPASLLRGNPGPGRLAVFVGDPGDPEVMAAAAAMDAELFGSSR